MDTPALIAPTLCACGAVCPQGRRQHCSVRCKNRAADRARKLRNRAAGLPQRSDLLGVRGDARPPVLVCVSLPAAVVDRLNERRGPVALPDFAASLIVQRALRLAAP
jgi:hypothetical protein